MVLRDVSSSKVRTSVGPGIYHPKKGNNTKMMQKKDDTNKRYIIGSDAEELAQPKYNSIMCTIDKLKEYQQQRIVTDINHLPSAQKNIINGKVRFYKREEICSNLLKYFCNTDFYSTRFSIR